MLAHQPACPHDVFQDPEQFRVRMRGLAVVLDG